MIYRRQSIKAIHAYNFRAKDEVIPKCSMSLHSRWKHIMNAQCIMDIFVMIVQRTVHTYSTGHKKGLN